MSCGRASSQRAADLRARRLGEVHRADREGDDDPFSPERSTTVKLTLESAKVWKRTSGSKPGTPPGTWRITSRPTSSVTRST
jgi:hypothetical protein